METMPSERVLELETAIMASKGDALSARPALLRYLRGMIESDDHGKGLSIATLLELGSRTGVTAELACVTMRCIAVDGLIPDKSASATITRSIVDICESGAQKVCKFIHLNTSSKTYEKIAVLLRAHSELMKPLEVLKTPFADLNSIISAEHQISGALNHGVMSFYCNVFGLAEIKKIVDEIFSKIRGVATFGQGLIDDLQSCRDVLASARAIAAEQNTFLSIDHLLPFVDNVERAISDLESSLKDRFSTKVCLASGQQLTKRYPLREVGRRLRISVPLTNEGPGKLVGLRASVTATDGLLVDNGTIILGDVTPGRFSIVVDGEVTSSVDECEILIDLEWGEIGSPSLRSEIFSVCVAAQTTAVDWTEIQFWAPYSTEPAHGSEFVGRGEKVREVASKILRTPMEPFYITGQKRVGKTSLALAAVAFAHANAGNGEFVKPRYILWGEVAHQDAHRTMHEIGSAFEDVIRSCVDLREFGEIDCSESLAPLVKLCHRAFEKDQKTKFVFIMDEFDEIHPELYLHGSLAETFFANIRALTKCRNVCVALIGGENMPYVMDRQGQKLNNFSRVSLNYYSGEREWDDYNLLIRSATKGVIDWHDDAVAELFNITNGSPYFTKIACAAVLRKAISERDADVTYEDVRRVVSDEISLLGANYFAHLWQDGIPKPVEDREPDILVRMRVLVSIANCLRGHMELAFENISSAQGSRELMGIGVRPVLNDFVRREVLDFRDGKYNFLLPIFRSWLEDVGASALVETSLSEELANDVLGAEEAAMVRADEIARLVKGWPTYRGRHVGSEEVRAWLSQVARAC